ncbi:helix-turn-helix domain-containing protein [Acidimicrobiaceae bacterium USS-CC1]|uniref:Helix-turn-helix domain-containing protein n=1 Tax=Acidiferrimicrobium australe TaxID=2664430 RepID=A0ABW9QQ31_9ACTN|nr:helix-turn-helix domain-containing protein [Acidiferrimicrobium australe]
MPPVEGGPASGRIQSVSRAVKLLMLVASGQTGSTGKELALAAGLPAPTAHHLLSTLVDEGLLAKDGSARYLLGMKVAVLADALQRAVTAPAYLLEPLRQLAATTGETAYVATWRQGDIRVQASVEGNHPVRVTLPLGPYTNAHARATGKVLLALASEELREAYLVSHPLVALTPRTIIDRQRLEDEFGVIRERGYAIDEGEFQPGVSCVSAPVVDQQVVVAAYSISVPTPRFVERRDWLVDATVAVARNFRPARAGRQGGES